MRLNQNTKIFGQRLKEVLSASGVERGELARHLGVSVPTVNRWLNGISSPNVYQFREIAHFFGLPYEWFLDGGAGLPSVEDLAELLGLNVDTLEELLLLAETENEDVLEPLDDAIFAVVSAFRTILEDYAAQ